MPYEYLRSTIFWMFSLSLCFSPAIDFLNIKYSKDMKKCFITFAVFVLMLLLAGALENSNKVIDESIAVSDASSVEEDLSYHEMSQ